MTGTPLEERLVAEVPGLRAFARSLTQDAAAADDLVQETVLRAWSNLDKFEEGTNLRAWLFTILRNTFISGKRKVKREVEDADGEHAGRLTEGGRQDGAAELGNFRRALARLPQDQREALMLVGAVGFTYDEAAEVCSVSPGTIKSRVNRARRRLDELLEAQGGAEGDAEGDARGDAQGNTQGDTRGDAEANEAEEGTAGGPAAPRAGGRTRRAS